MVVELIYDRNCPNVEASRRQLLTGFAAARMTPCWREWVRNSSTSPDYVHRFGSPTILVDGKDIGGSAASEGADCCRIYISEEGHMTGIPSQKVARA